MARYNNQIFISIIIEIIGERAKLARHSQRLQMETVTILYSKYVLSSEGTSMYVIRSAGVSTSVIKSMGMN